MPKVHARRRVARGVAFLDETRPEWYKEVSIATLDIDSCYNCIAAQLSGKNSYNAGIKVLGLNHAQAARLGMDGKGCISYEKREYERLTKRWVEEIRFRREADELLRSEAREKVDA